MRLVPLCLMALLAGCAGANEGMLTPQGPVADEQLRHILYVTILCLIVVLPVIIGVPLLAWRYRLSNRKAAYAPNWDFSHTLEWFIWGVPVLVIIALSVYLWVDTHRLAPYRPIAGAGKPIRVEVVGLDWKWLFIYPDYHIATVGELAFPQNRPVSMRLTTDTVMQSFMVPELVGQVYAMPGMVTQLEMDASRDGSFDGMNTQYNGDGFDSQHFRAVAMDPKQFENWVREVQHKGVALNGQRYAQLAESSTTSQVRRQFGTPAMPAGVTYFNTVAPDAFSRVLMRYMDGKPVPPDLQPGTAAYDRKISEMKGAAQ